MIDKKETSKKTSKETTNEIIEDFDYIKINIASPERIREWGERVLPTGQIVGEVTKAETINYRTLKPEMDGLFCEKIFGPIKNYECNCGKYKGRFNQGLFCDRCDVEITEARVRRHRMGYIDLLTPVAHVWYLKGVPSYLSHVLEQPLKDVEQIVYFNESIEEKIVGLDKYLGNEEEFLFGQEIQTAGAEVIYTKLKNINLIDQIALNRNLINSARSNKVSIRRIRILESFLTTNSKPEWMVLTLLPVLPPNLRPLVRLEGGRFAGSDLNELYRRVITRNNRLARLLALYAPEIVVRSEKRMLQEAVDALIDNGKRGQKSVDINNRPLKSLADIIEGKQGRFRQNLLGKRVDYSGRSVIIVGPHLQLNECGLPFEIATELFYPFIVHELISKGIAGTIKMAKKTLVSNEPFVWPLVKKIIGHHPILLNRAPTLHRLGIQAFEPVLVRGRAIQLHPLVCPAFNADFDGDQMGVHIPLSLKAQIEARLLMLAPNNFLSPATGEPIIHPTQDMLLGCYYLTLNNRPHLKGSNHYFSNFEDVILAYKQNQVSLHSYIWVRFSENFTFGDNLKYRKTIKLDNESEIRIYNNLQIKVSKTGEVIVQYLRTTAGRIIFNQVINRTCSI
jgi:DNA-directed RNA polymerase subunit beta'